MGRPSSGLIIVHWSYQWNDWNTSNRIDMNGLRSGDIYVWYVDLPSMQTARTNSKMFMMERFWGFSGLNLREPFLYIYIDWSQRYPNSTSHRKHKITCSLIYQKWWTLWPSCGYIFMTLAFFSPFPFYPYISLLNA